MNEAWNGLSRFQQEPPGREGLTRFLDWIKGVTLGFDGAAHRTMMSNDAYWFFQLGGTVERADNTARLLDVKYHLLLPENEPVGGSLDYFQWTTILREVSALTALSLGVSRYHSLLARRRPVDPEPDHAALAGQLLCRRGPAA